MVDLTSAAIGAAEAHQVSASSALGKSRFARILQEGGELAGDEWARQIVQQRAGVTLRSGRSSRARAIA
jgi:hypothetical protein